MQCRYCGADNPDSARICVSCNKLIPVASARNASRNAGYAYVGRDKRAGPYSDSPQFGVRTRVQTLRRTRRLTGTTLPKSTPPTMSRQESKRARRSPDPDARTRAYSEATRNADSDITRFGYDRTEPSWSETPPSSSVNASYDRLHHDVSPTAGKARPTRRGKLLRVLFMAGIFVVGAGAGLVGAWWFSRPAAVPVVTAVQKLSPNTGQGAAENVRRGAVTGISPSELPYDGAAPPRAAENMQQATDATTKSPSPATRVVVPLADKGVNTNAPVTSSADASGNSAVADGVVSSGDSSSDADVSDGRTPSAVNQETLRDGRKEYPSTNAVTTKPSVAKAASRFKDGDGAKVSNTPKRTTPAKRAKDREIERIKRQAEDELKKKSEPRRQVNRSRANPARTESRQSQPLRRAANLRVANNSSMRSMLARCERAPNILRREQCKWRLCGGTWGRNGCPSYQRHNTHTD